MPLPGDWTFPLVFDSLYNNNKNLDSFDQALAIILDAGYLVELISSWGYVLKFWNDN